MRQPWGWATLLSELGVSPAGGVEVPAWSHKPWPGGDVRPTGVGGENRTRGVGGRSVGAGALLPSQSRGQVEKTEVSRNGVVLSSPAPRQGRVPLLGLQMRLGMLAGPAGLASAHLLPR